MSIDPRMKLSDNTGVCPCVPPVLLGRLLDRASEVKAPTTATRIVKKLRALRRKLGL